MTEKQSELFDEFQRGEQLKRPLGRDVLPNKAFVFSLPYDKLTLAVIGIILCAVVIFVLGFECGRGSSVRRYAVARPVVMKVSAPVAQPVTPKPPPPKPVLLKPYTVQVASFRSKELAQQEAANLRGRGFLPTIIGINNLYEVLAGEYADIREATQAQNVLRKYYKDCLIRKR